MFKITKGYVIAFLGTDGSGKSTIIDNITPLLNETFPKSVYYEHMRPNKLPSIAKLLRKQEDFNTPVTEPHKQNPSGFAGSILRFGYYWLDYTLGYWLKVFPKKAFKSCVWIFDRYYYDYLLDQRRARICLPKWIIQLGQIFIPEPDIIVCLGTDAKTIHKRKPELELKEVERQVNELKYFCQNHKLAVWIDTGKAIELSINETFVAITKIMDKRLKKVSL